MGVLIVRALVFDAYIRAPDSCNLPLLGAPRPYNHEDPTFWF